MAVAAFMVLDLSLGMPSMVAAQPLIFLDYRAAVTMAVVAPELVLCWAAERVEGGSSTESRLVIQKVHTYKSVAAPIIILIELNKLRICTSLLLWKCIDL